MTKGISDCKIVNYYQQLETQWSPYLSESQRATLVTHTQFLSTYNSGLKQPYTKITLRSATQQLTVYEEKIETRKREIATTLAFIKECESYQEQLQNHRLRLESELKVNNNDVELNNIQNDLKYIDNYLSIISCLKELAIRIKESFVTKKFNKGLKDSYPQMVKEVAELLKKIDMQLIVHLSEGQIKQDIQIVLRTGADISTPKKMNSMKWIVFLKEIYSVTNIYTSPLIRKTDKQWRQEFLFDCPTKCEKKIKEYVNKKKELEKSITLPINYKEVFLEHVEISIYYFYGLKELIETTQTALENDTVRDVYIQMVQNFAALLKQNNLMEPFKKLLEGERPFVKRIFGDFFKALKGGPIDPQSLDIAHWIIVLKDLVDKGDKLLGMIKPKACVLPAVQTDKFKVRDSNNTASYVKEYQKLIIKISLYLTDNQIEQFKDCLRFLTFWDGKQDNEPTLNSAYEELNIFKQLVKRRKNVLIAIGKFIDSCEQRTRQPFVYQKNTSSENDDGQLQKWKQYLAFITGLKQSALVLQKAYDDRVFDAGLPVRYPQMVKELAALMIETEKVQNFEGIPDDDQTKKDLLCALQNNAAVIQIPEQFSSAIWIMLLVGLLERADQSLSSNLSFN